MRPIHRRGAAARAALLALAACAPGAGNENMAQQVIELGDALNDVRQENSALQEQIDSLRTQLARQDTIVRRVANLAGVPVP